MASFNSTNYNNQQLGLTPKPSPAGETRQVRRMYASVAVTSALALNDVLNFFTLPRGARIVDAALYSTDLDTGGPTITIDVGDLDGAATIFSASTAAQAGTFDRSPVKSVIDKQYLVDTLIKGTIHAAATTPAAGTVYLTVWYTHDGLPTS